MTCENCDWSTCVVVNQKLECRFNPPTVDVEVCYAVFPIVRPDWWCSKDTTTISNYDDDSNNDVSEEEALELIGDALDDGVG